MEDSDLSNRHDLARSISFHYPKTLAQLVDGIFRLQRKLKYKYAFQIDAEEEKGEATNKKTKRTMWVCCLNES